MRNWRWDNGSFVAVVAVVIGVALLVALGVAIVLVVRGFWR